MLDPRRFADVDWVEGFNYLEFEGLLDENGLWEDQSQENILSEDDSEWPIKT